MSTYAFRDCKASITGPGGAGVQLGDGAGAAEEGITVSMETDKTTTTTGADGSIMHSLHSSNTGTMTTRLLKTSPVNAQLSALYTAQRQSSALWGQNTIVIVNPATGDVITGTQMAFVKLPDIVYALDGGTNEWAFRGVITEVLGTGTPVAA